MDGIILINKEENMTSHDVISRLRKILKTKKIGHCGTLDPLATGVLVCLVNKATKLSNYLVLDSKEYIATFKLGQATTTQDLEGEIVAEKEYLNEYTKKDIALALDKFTGVQKQTPSIYSAIKVNGKKLYEYARANEDVEIPSREIEIKELELLNLESDLVTIRVLCSSGTYIRTLCCDIANYLGYPGVLTSLNRTKSGNFTLSQSHSLKEVENGNYQLVSINEALVEYNQIQFDKKIVSNIMNGIPIEIESEQRFIALDENMNVLAIYDKSVNGKAKMLRGLW